MKKLLLIILFLPFLAAAQTDRDTISLETPSSSKWYERVSLRGYVQVRYNRLLETNENLKCDQCDRSWGKDGGFFFRRVRLVFFGQISSRMYIYIQPDFASSVSSSSLNFGQIRDAYFDLGLDRKNEFRLRFGQSKIPYGFENMQSSQNRLPLDRSDGINSAFVNERDLGVMFYWAPAKIRKRFAMLVADGYKGSGDYGVLGLSVFNGQGANRPDQNNSPHVAGHLTYPFAIGTQIIEPAVYAYAGKWTMGSDLLSTGTKFVSGATYDDRRIGASVVMYPRPFGFQAEWNVGRGPRFNTVTDSIESGKVSGGYAMVNAMLRLPRKMLLYPFVRAQYYDGGKKFELDARSYNVKELELGLEWQPVRSFELVAMYTISSRRFEDFKAQNNLQEGRLLRLQAQLNF